MTEYIVCVDDLEELYYRCTDIKPETVFGHRLREEIVRCRDCRYYNTHTEPPECYREGPGRIVAPDGFCACGEQRDDAE